MIDEFMAEDDLELVEVHINMKTIYTSTKKLCCHLRGICFDYIALDCTIWLIAVFKQEQIVLERSARLNLDPG